MLIRIISAIVMLVLVLLGLFLLPSIFFNSLLLLIMLASLWEWRALCEESTSNLYFNMLIILAIFSLYHWGLKETNTGSILLIVGVILWFFKAFRLSKPIKIFGLPCLLEGALLLSIAWYAMVYLRDQYGAMVLLLGLLMVWSADTFAYFGGKFFGKTKLAPSISPGKTREGAAVGVMMAILVALAYSHIWISPITHLTTAIMLASITALVALISIVGDLSISQLKRKAGIKDSSNLIPGHGGLLDRIDGLIAGIVFFAFYTRLQGWF